MSVEFLVIYSLIQILENIEQKDLTEYFLTLELFVNFCKQFLLSRLSHTMVKEHFFVETHANKYTYNDNKILRQNV